MYLPEKLDSAIWRTLIIGAENDVSQCIVIGDNTFSTKDSRSLETWLEARRQMLEYASPMMLDSKLEVRPMQEAYKNLRRH
jgi:hypothetical protein